MLETTLSNQSKVWIYQSTTAFTTDEKEMIDKQLHQFVSNWQSHGDEVKGFYKIIKDHFIVMIADDTTSVSGCSIDSSVAVIRTIESQLGRSLLDKSLIAYEDADAIKMIALPEIPKAVEDKSITPDTIIYNNSISTLEQLDQNWKVAAKDSWMKRYF